MAKARPVFEGQVCDEGGRGRRLLRGPQEGQLRLAQGAGALHVELALLLPLLSPEFDGSFTMFWI